ncbi:hypothetical protein MMC29_004701 [Sticta canariensis]|nr:hypothetical protein [Sticta canariensis]
MAGQKNPRPAKRHLITHLWESEMQYSAASVPGLKALVTCTSCSAELCTKRQDSSASTVLVDTHPTPTTSVAHSIFVFHTILTLELHIPRFLMTVMTNIAMGGLVTDLQIDELDKKLILTIQYVCNADGIKIPWDKVGAIMGEGISDGAVIQHLAKLRQRMLSLNLSVPPPLRRGGGYAIPTSSGGNLGSSNSTLTKYTKKGIDRKTPSSAAVSRKNKESLDVDKASDSGVYLENTRSKRVKSVSKGKRRNSKVEKGESDEDEKSFSDRAAGRGKRRRGETSSTPRVGQEKKDSKTSKPTVRARRSTIKYDELSESDSDEEYEDSHSEDAEHEITEEEFVAAKATFLRSESPYDESESEEERNDSALGFIPKKDMSNSSSKIVVLQIGNSKHARQFLEDLESMSGNETDLDSESQEEQDEMENDIVQDVLNANVAVSKNPQMGDGHTEYEKAGFNQPSRGGFRPLGNNFSGAVAMSHTSQAGAQDLSHHSTYHQLNLLNSAPTIPIGASLNVEDSTMTGVQVGTYQFPDESFNNQSFIGSKILPSPSFQGGGYNFAGHTSSGQDFAPNWISGAGDHSFPDRNQISSAHTVHRHSIARFDPAPASSSLYVPTVDGTRYSTPNNRNRSGDKNGNQQTTVSAQRANFENSPTLNSDIACGMNVNRYSREMLNQTAGSNYQSHSVEHDLNNEPFFPVTHQRTLSPSTRGAVQQADGPSISMEPFSATDTTTSNYDLSPLVNMPVADFDSPRAYSAGQVQRETQDGLGDGDEYSMLDAFDFASFDADFGNENTFA